MVQINFAQRRVNCKIVYYGPGRSGKTTNLEKIHENAPGNTTGELVSIATETDRTLYFDFLPLELGKVGGMETKFSLYTVPGQVFYAKTRRLVLQGTYGVVFVADSNPAMMKENLESVEDLVKNLRENGLDIKEIPIVFQWNKRDLAETVPVEEMNAQLNRWNAPSCKSIAIHNEGVFDALKLVAGLVIRKLNREFGRAPAGAQKSAPAQTPPPAPRTAAAPRAQTPPPAPPVAPAASPKPTTAARRRATPPPAPQPTAARPRTAGPQAQVPGTGTTRRPAPAARAPAPPPPPLPPPPPPIEMTEPDSAATPPPARRARRSATQMIQARKEELVSTRPPAPSGPSAAPVGTETERTRPRQVRVRSRGGFPTKVVLISVFVTLGIVALTLAFLVVLKLIPSPL